MFSGGSISPGRQRFLLATVLSGALAWTICPAARRDLPAATAGQAAASADSLRWPDGTVQVPFEDLDGVALLRATLTGADGRDTSGALVLDTGAGFVAIDDSLAVTLGIAARHARGQIDFARAPLPRLRLGDLDFQQAQAITFDAGAIREVIDRPVLGLFGQQPMNDRTLWIDYQSHRVALIPAGLSGSASPLDSRASAGILAGLLSPRAIAVPFRMAPGGKVLIQARIVPKHGAATSWRTFVFDTGATKCALFVHAGDRADPTARWRPSIRALETPTLTGRSPTSLTRATRVEVRGRDGGGETDGGHIPAGEPRVSSSSEATAAAPDVDVLLVDSPLGEDLSRASGETVEGLLGYSFLRRFRVACDYPHRVLWLDPVPHFVEDRPFEHSHVGVQLERGEDGTVRVMAVARPSPAQRAGIHAGDELVMLGHALAGPSSLADLSRLMEGKPGTVLRLTIRRDGREIRYVLRRRRLL